MDFSFNTRSHGKITSLWGKSQWDSRGYRCTNIFFQSKMVLDIPKKDEEEDDLEEATSTNQTVDRMKGTGQPV